MTAVHFNMSTTKYVAEDNRGPLTVELSDLSWCVEFATRHMKLKHDDGTYLTPGPVRIKAVKS